MTLAFVFPGQGSQSIGMLADLARDHAEVEQTFAEASAVLGYDLWNVVQQGPEDHLNQTTTTQPAMLAADVAVWRVWRKLGGAVPDLVAGHSLGEYAALVCAGAIDFTDAISLVAERGRLMQAAVPEGQGAMAAILGLDDDAVREVCTLASNGEVVEAVNFNSPGQVVIAGQTTAVERAVAAAKEKGAKRALVLPVSVPSHCTLMKPAADQLSRHLSGIEIRTPTFPVLHNVDVSSHDDGAAIREALAGQLYRPVRWVETIQAMEQRGASILVEVGPGKVLVGLNKRITKNMTALPVYDSETMREAIAHCGG